jgi:tetratricopeptide (TPR) repeat protein
MDASADLALMRASMLLEADPAGAARQAGDILANSPGHAEAALLLAAACRRLGDPATAIRVLESLVGAHAGASVLQLELGRAYAAGGRHDAAIEAFQRAVELDAALADGWRELAAQRFLAGDTAAGDAAYLKYSRLAHEPPELTDANVARAADRLDAAEAMVRRHLQRAPRDVAALRMLADLAGRRGDTAEAERRITEALESAPGDAAARLDLARLLCLQERVAEAMPLIERLLVNEPRNSSYLCLMARALRLDGRTQEAIVLMEELVAECPGDVQAWLTLGNILRVVGQQARAIASFRRALDAQPAFGEAYWALANLKTFRFTDSDVASMRQQLARQAPGSKPIHLQFALGKALEDAGEYAESFDHYSRGAAQQRAKISYDPAATTEYVRRSKAAYTAGFFAGRPGGSERRDPIFIVGLPRSGSTLLEQILASHSQVEGTRELPDVPAMVMELAARAEYAYPEVVASLGKEDIEGLAARYLAATEARRPRRLPRFVDKMLGNFSHLGLIQVMFPNAAIIDARRHPLGCGFSCYKQLFAQGMNFSYDLDEMGRYYRDYAELMQHIDTVLPGRVHRVHYELLVTDPENELRRLLDYCGLPFEEECLRFYENPRAVQTISSEQVRQPIYSGAIEQWRHFEPWLGPLKDAVGEWLERYPCW